MAYTTTFSMSLGASKAGLTLAAQLVDTAGVAVGSEITSGFVELDNGSYLLTTVIPTGHRGAMKVYRSGVTATTLALAAINPEELEPEALTGSVAFTYTVTISGGTTPIPDAEVKVSTDRAGTHVIARDYTDNFGVVTFNLDPGTYYFWTTKAGYNFTNPDEEEVSA